MNKNFKILGAVMLGFMSFSCNNNQGNNSSEATDPQYGSRTYNSETLRIYYNNRNSKGS